LAQEENQGVHLAMAASLVESSVGGSTAGAAAAATTTAAAAIAPAAAVRLDDFIGKWRDSIGHQVSVTWARKEHSSGELDVQLRRPHAGSRAIHLNVKALGLNQFQCGHFELKLDESSTEKIVWGNTRTGGKDSVWQRDEHSDRARSRSRSSSRRGRRNCGCVMIGKVALRCVDHPPLLPPRSVLHDILTPGAWAPPAQEPEIAENRSDAEQVSMPPATWKGSCPAAKATEVSAKPADADALLKAYDERLAKASPDVPFGEAFLAKGKLLVEHFQGQAADETDKLVPDMLFDLKNWHSATVNKGKGLPQDPRLRSRVASTGGA